jgi:Cu-Zn family superoxide dismutase
MERAMKRISTTASVLAATLAWMTLGVAQAAPLTADMVLKPTQGSATAGSVRFTQQDGKLQIDADIAGLSPGVHGFHLHEKGDCSAPDGTSAGGHFNPAGLQHGGPEHGARHGGDFGNITADANGKASLRLSVPTSQITLETGVANSIIGRGIIVHADPDDFVTQPTGNAGKRVACGVVVAGK